MNQEYLHSQESVEMTREIFRLREVVSLLNDDIQDLLITLKAVNVLYHSAEVNGGTKAAYKSAFAEAARRATVAIKKAKEGA